MRIAIAGATGLIGTKLTALAERKGHDVVPISRASGFDLTDATAVSKLTAALAGVDAVIDVTQGADFDEDGAVTFFRAVGEHLGRAAMDAGVPRTVVLSIVGIERSPDYGYYVGKVAHEAAHRASSPGVAVLRATQFHDFAAQMIEWFTEDGVARVMDVATQPVDSDVVVATLLEMATAERALDLQIAGPRVEQLLDLSRRYAMARGLDVRVEAGDAPPSMTGGAMVPQESDGVVTRGDDWSTWLSHQH